MSSKILRFAQALAVTLALGIAGSAQAGLIAIINGASTTSETSTTSDITTNLNTLLIAAGNTTTILDTVPADLSPYGQIWDIRFSNSSPITASVETQYLNYLQNGGGMFVMGENAGFATRNTSVLQLISDAGGGSLNFVTPASTQDVVSPFTGPNVIADGNVTYAAPGGVDGSGNGQFITTDGTNGTGVAFGVGDLTNAPTGALTAIFDVNFMQGTVDQPDSQDLLKNLIGYVQNQVGPGPGTVPEPGTVALLGIGLIGMGFARRRMKSAR